MDSRQRKARVPVTVRLTREVIERLEHLIVDIQEDYPSFSLTLADGVRVAIEEGLAAHERRQRGRTRKSDISAPKRPRG